MNNVNIKLLIIVILCIFTGCKEESINHGNGADINVYLGKVDTVSANVMFKPDSNTSYYEYALGFNSDYDSFQDGTMDGMVRVDGSDSAEVVFPSLLPDTIYAVYARAYSKDGQSAGINVCQFSTADDKFKVEQYYLLDNTAGFKVSCTGEYYSFRYYMGKSSERDAFVNGDIPGSVKSNIKDYYVVNYFDLEPETDYVFYVVGTDRLGISTELFEVPVRTFPADACPNMELETDIDIYSGEYKLIPNDKCGKIIGCVSHAGKIDGGWYGDQYNAIQLWESAGTMGTVSAWGGNTLVITYLTPEMGNGVPIEMYAVICDKDNNPVGLKYFEFTTPAFDESLSLPNPVEIEVSDITSSGATYNFRADNTVFGYMYETVEADWYDDFKENSSEWHETYLHDRFFSQGYYWQYGNGSFVFVEKTGQRNFRYYAAAAPMNANGPRAGGWGKITLIPYTTGK